MYLSCLINEMMIFECPMMVRPGHRVKFSWQRQQSSPFPPIFLIYSNHARWPRRPTGGLGRSVRVSRNWWRNLVPTPVSFSPLSISTYALVSRLPEAGITFSCPLSFLTMVARVWNASHVCAHGIGNTYYCAKTPLRLSWNASIAFLFAVKMSNISLLIRCLGFYNSFKLRCSSNIIFPIGGG